MRVILDASTALAAVLPDEDSTFARAAVGASVNDGLVVPTLWLYEIQNGLATAVRRQRIDRTSAYEALQALQGLAPEIQSPQGLGRELRLAQTHALTAYDAAYLAVALNTGRHSRFERRPASSSGGKRRSTSVRACLSKVEAP